MKTGSGLKEISTAYCCYYEVMKMEFHILLLWLFLFRALTETPFALIHISLFPVNARQSHTISLDIY